MNDPLLAVRGLTKVYAGQRALDDAYLDLYSGGAVALAGHNGSGKSTFVKVLCGYVGAEAGTGTFRGQPFDLSRAGKTPDWLHVVHQDLGLVAELTVAEQFALSGDAVGWGRGTDKVQHATAALERFGVTVSPKTLLGDLTRGQQALVALARVAYDWADPHQILVLDEVTSPLGVHEVDKVFTLLHQLKSEGAGVILVTHRPDEMLSTCDQILVLRNGRIVADLPAEGTTEGRLVREIAGDGQTLPEGRMETRRRELIPALAAPAGQARRKQLSRAKTASADSGAPLRISVTSASGSDYEVEAGYGQVVGVVGTIGSGHDELVSLLASSTARSAEITVRGRTIRGGAIGRMQQAGVRLMPKDRLKLGIVPSMSATENVILAKSGQSMWTRNRAREVRDVRRWFEVFDVRPQRPGRELRLFSGGNQQKVILARTIAAEPSMIVVDEPTEGVDFGARIEIVAALRAWVASGERAVVACLSDIDIAVDLCDEIVVVRQGRAVERCRVADMTRTQLLDLVTGVTDVTDVTDEQTTQSAATGGRVGES
jgi:ABC-type sugar transport system ATPase subunit